MRQLLIGLLALVSLGLLAFFTLFLSGSALFGDPMKIMAQFDNGDGLGEGDPVLAAGIRIGRVDSITYDPDAPVDTRITVRMRLDRQIALHEDYSIQIADSSLLGGHMVLIEPGSPGVPMVALSEDSALSGFVKPDVFDTLGSFGEFGPALDDVRAMITELREGGAIENLNAGIERFSSAAGNIDTLTTGLAAGEGTFGKLFADDSFFRTWSDVGAGANETLAAVRSGEGTLGALINDQELRERVSSAVTNIDTSFDSISKLTDPAGEGLLGALANDSGLTEDVRRTARNIADLSDKAAAGESTLGALLGSTELYDNINQFAAKLNSGEGLIARLTEPSALFDEVSAIVSDFRSVSGRIAAGEGTLGRLLVDDEIYQQLVLALRVLTRSLEDYREAAPITTFTSLLTAGF